MKPFIGVMCAALAFCEGPPLIVGDLPDSGGTGGGAAGGAPQLFCAGGCSSSGMCITTAANTTTACGFDAGLCIDCSVAVQHASIVSCNAGLCDFFACETGWSDCDGDRSNGCERNVPACFEVVATDQQWPSNVSTDGIDVFWQVSNGTVRKVAKTGGTITDLATTSGPFLLYGPSIYLATDTTLSVMPKGGGTPTLLITTSPGGFGGLTTDGASFFWTAKTVDGQTQLKSAPMTGGIETLLLGGIQKPIRSLTSIGTELWFLVDRDVLRLPKTGGTANLVAKIPAQPSPTPNWTGDVTLLAPDHAFWTVTTKDTSIGSIPSEAIVLSMRYGAAVGTRLADISFTPLRLVVDGAFVYVAAMRDITSTGWGAILRIPIAGGKADVLAFGQTPYYWLAVDDESVYWGELDPSSTVPRGEIRKTSKLR